MLDATLAHANLQSKRTKPIRYRPLVNMLYIPPMAAGAAPAARCPPDHSLACSLALHSTANIQAAPVLLHTPPTVMNSAMCMPCAQGWQHTRAACPCSVCASCQQYSCTAPGALFLLLSVLGVLAWREGLKCILENLIENQNLLSKYARLRDAFVLMRAEKGEALKCLIKLFRISPFFWASR